MPSKKRLDKEGARLGKELIAISNTSGGGRAVEQTDVPRVITRAGPSAEFAYEEFLHARIRNSYTRRNYRRAIERFFRWTDKYGFVLQQILPQHVGHYLDSLQYGPATKKLHLAALRHLFDRLVTRHVVVLNPAATVRGERHQVIEGKTPEITVAQARRLLGSIDTTTVVGLRDWAVVGVLVYTAARVGAVARLLLRDFVAVGNQHSLRFMDKGGKSREIPVRSDLEQVLVTYLAQVATTEADVRSHLFRTARGKTGMLTTCGMTRGDICRMVKRRLRDAGLPQQISPHSFRVATITDLLTQGVPLADVQHLAGHADPRTTRLYDRRRRRVTRNIVERISI